MSKHFGWYDNWREEILTCSHCGWSGKIGQSATGYSWLAKVDDFNCPNCWTMLATIRWPSYPETKEAATAGNTDAIKALPWWEDVIAGNKARREKFNQHKLTRANQLPDITGDNLRFVWDVERSDDQYFVLECRHGSRYIVKAWKELAWYGDEAHFKEVERALEEKYGRRFGGLELTEASKTLVYDLED